MTTDANPNPPTENPPGADPNLNANPPSTWWGGIDFGDAKDAASSALGAYKTPADLLGALDWRKQLSGGDESAYKMFERFTTPQDAGKTFIESQKKIRAGELAKPLGKDATPEQIADWRKGNGVPEKPDGYFEKLPNGLVIGEDDKPLFEQVATKLHARNVQPEVIHDLVEWYHDMQDEQIQAQQVADLESKKKLEGALRTAWGAEFGPNSNVYASFVDTLPKEVRESLTQARDAEGNFVLYRPEVVSWLTSMAREINPAAHIVPASGGGGLQSVQSEIDGIEKTMRENRTSYNKDEKMQARYRQLLEARIKLQERGRAA